MNNMYFIYKIKVHSCGDYLKPNGILLFECFDDDFIQLESELLNQHFEFVSKASANNPTSTKQYYYVFKRTKHFTIHDVLAEARSGLNRIDAKTLKLKLDSKE